MSMSSKSSIHTQDACKRVRNFCPTLPWTMKVAEINKLMWQMVKCEYGEKVREIVARRVLGKIKMNE